MRLRAWLASVLIAVSFSATAPAYVHFLRYFNRDGRAVAIPTRFDLAALPNRTVPFYIAPQGPERLTPGDSVAALTSQIRLAARIWSEVDTSELRLAYAGDVSDTGLSTPGIDVTFGDIPPGLLAMAGVTTAEPGPGAAFVPIQRAQIVLARDLTEQPSFAEQTFLTIVHEFGHTLGLQHTQTASVMSTALTRSQTKGRVLSADDIAGISVLYPTRSFQPSLGAIAGRVTLGGSGVPMASVVAIAPSGAAVGALTGPDGSYRIEGLPPGSYGVYVQPLPPPQTGEVTPDNLLLPIDAEQRTVQPQRNFDTLFFPGVRESSSATLLAVTAGSAIEGVNFSVSARSNPPRIFNLQSYSFPGQVAVRPAFVNLNGSRLFFVASGNGILASPTQATPGLQASLFGANTQISGVRSYSANFLQFDLGLTSQSGPGVRHGVFMAPGELYVQPSIVTLTSQPPPQISQVLAIDPRTVLLVGSQLSADTTVLADGVPAIVRAADPDRLTVSIPPAPAGHRMVLTAINPDGQSSLFLQGSSPSTYTHEAAEPVALSLSPSSLPAGAEAAIEINASGSNFTEGWVTVSFGSPDIIVRRTWVLSPTRLLVQVQVSPSASPGSFTPVIVSGLRTLNVPGGFLVVSGSPRVPLGLLSSNPVTGVGSTQSGGQLLLLVGGPSASSATVTLAGRTAAATMFAPGIFIVAVPPGLPAGPAILRVQAGSELSFPFAIQIDPPAEVQWESGRTMTAGETVTLPTTGFSLFPLQKPRVYVYLGSVEHVARLQPNGQVTFVPLPSVPAGNQSLVVSVDGRTSSPVSVVVR